MTNKIGLQQPGAPNGNLNFSFGATEDGSAVLIQATALCGAVQVAFALNPEGARAVLTGLTAALERVRIAIPGSKAVRWNDNQEKGNEK